MPDSNLESLLQSAMAHHQAGRLDEAARHYQQILTLQPDHPFAIHYLGLIAQARGQLDSALDLFTRSIALAPPPSVPQFHYNIASLYLSLHRPDDAIHACEQALTLQPDYPRARVRLAEAQHSAGQFDAALATLRSAITFHPNDPELHYNLGQALQGLHRLDEAHSTFQQAASLAPTSIAIQNALGTLFLKAGRVPEALAAFRNALTISSSPVIHSNLLLALHYHTPLSPDDLFREHLAWAQRHAASFMASIPSFTYDRSSERPLRIGYLSPNFQRNIITPFFEPLLSHHDHAGFHITCYADGMWFDEVTHRLRACSDAWRFVGYLSDDQLADQIRADRIDILIDLAGHTAGHRLLVFARRPAPVQITYLGYPDTTGLSAIQYRLTDPFADPPGLTERLHSEELIRLPDTAWCYQGIGENVPIAPLPRASKGYIAFGSFNNLAKISPTVLNLWSRILQAVPNSRLILKAGGLDTALAQSYLTAQLAAGGIDAQRVELRPFVLSTESHLAAYHDLDIALDTYPYHGTNTTCEALWMGVPVITLAGPTHVSRVGVSLLTNVGLPDLVASTADQYVQRAAELAADLPRLESLRQTLRQRLQNSPLMDAPRFARAMEQTYRALWHRHIARELIPKQASNP